MTHTFRISISLVSLVLVMFLTVDTTNALIPYTSTIWDMMLPSDDPFRILGQHPPYISNDVETQPLARADWKETSSGHIILLDIPGLKKDDVKIEVQENRVLWIRGGRKEEEEHNYEKWHRIERRNGRFWTQFLLESNADFDHIKVSLEDGVLRIYVPKLAENQKRQPKIIDIAQYNSKIIDIPQHNSVTEDMKATKTDM